MKSTAIICPFRLMCKVSFSLSNQCHDFSLFLFHTCKKSSSQRGEKTRTFNVVCKPLGLNFYNSFKNTVIHLIITSSYDVIILLPIQINLKGPLGWTGIPSTQSYHFCEIFYIYLKL